MSFITNFAQRIVRRLVRRAIYFVALLAAVVGYGYWEQRQLGLSEQIGEVAEDPRFQQMEPKLLAMAGTEGHTPLPILGNQHLPAIGALARQGMHVLDDTTLVRGARVVAAVLQTTDDTTTCARIAERPLLDELFSNVMLLHDADTSITKPWIDLTFLAANRRLAGRKPRPLPPDSAQQAMAALLERLSPAQRTRLVRTLTQPSASKADQCWAARTLYGGVAKLHEPEKSWLARAVWPDA